MTDLTSGNDIWGDDEDNTGDDTIDGKGGNDTIIGGAGDDNLTGNTGNDNLQGGDDDDTLSGGSGDDVLDGGTGHNTIVGGSNTVGGFDTAIIDATIASGIGSRNGGIETITLNAGATVDDISGVERIQFNGGVTITVTAAGDALAYAGADTSNLDEQSNVSTDSAHGVLANDVDIDDSIDHVTGFAFGDTLGTVGSGTISGNYGTLSMNADGSYTYTADPSTDQLSLGDTATDVFSYTFINSNGVSSTGQLTINVNGLNDAPIVDAISGITYTDTSGNDNFAAITSAVSATDVDQHDTLTYAISGGSADASHSGYDHSFAGSYGTLYINSTTGEYTYVASDAAMEATKTSGNTDSFSILVDDGHTGTSTSLVITVDGANDKPALAAISGITYTDTANADSFNDATGTLQGSDRDNDSLTYALSGSAGDDTVSGFDQSLAGNYGKLYLNTTTGEYKYVADDSAIEGAKTDDSDVFHLTSSDGALTSGDKTLTVTVHGVNDTPVITASAPTTDLTESGGVNNADVGTLTASGTMSLSDRDTGDTASFDTTALTNNGWVNDGGGFWHKIGTYGTATLDVATGNVVYGVNDNDSDTQALRPGQTVHDIFTLYATDGTAGNSTTIDFTIHGANDAAVVGGATSGTATEAGGVNNGTAGAKATGTVTDTDVDNTANKFVAVSTATASDNGYGTFKITADGVWTFTVNNSNATVQALNSTGGNTTLNETFTVHTKDGTAQVITVAINGANDAAIIGGTKVGDATEASGDHNATSGSGASGQLTDTDVDNPNNTFQVVTGASSSHGSYAIDANGNWTYTVNENDSAVEKLNTGKTLTDTFTVHTVDGTAQVVTVTIHGANDAAVVGGDTTGSATEAGGINNGTPGTNFTGHLSDTDVDNGANMFTALATTAGDNGYGTFKMSTNGTWTYKLDNTNTDVQGLNSTGGNTTLTDTITVTTKDGTQQVLTVTIHGTNDTAVIGGTITGDATEAGEFSSGSTASGNLTAADVDNTPNTFQAVGTATFADHSYGKFTVDGSGHWAYFIDDTNASVEALNSTGPNTTLTDTFTVYAEDGTAQVITVTIHGQNDAAVIGGDITGTATDIDNHAGGASAVANPNPYGTVTDSDVDNPANTFQAATGTGANHHGTFAIEADGDWIYTVDQSDAAVDALTVGQSVSDSFTVYTQDGTAQVITITINGVNDAADIGGNTSGSVVEANTTGPGTPNVVGNLTVNDVDSADTFQAVASATATDNGYGTYTLGASGHWKFVLDNANTAVNDLSDGEHLTDSFTAVTADGTEQVVTITINGANERSVGTTGADVMSGYGHGGDTMVGLAGSDTYIIDNVHDKIVENAGSAGEDLAQASVSYTLDTNVEDLTLVGGASIDGTGNGDANLIVGNVAGNILSGLDGDDVINGSDGNDTLIGGNGDDRMDGEAGSDTASYAGAGAAVTVSLAIAGFQNTGGAGFDKLISIENLTGSDFNDSLTGSSAANVIQGGLGADTLTGGGAADSFYFGAVNESSGANFDTITDLNASVDHIYMPNLVNAIDATQTMTNLSELGTKFDAAHLAAGDAALAQVSGVTYLVVDANGTAGYQNGADFLIKVDGMTGTLTTSTFVGIV